MFKRTMKPTDSPWGSVQHAEEIAPGWWAVETAGHGGYLLSAERNATVPANARHATFCGQGKSGVYEEDCDWAIAVALFSEEWQAFHLAKGTPENVVRDHVAYAKEYYSKKVAK